MACSSIGHFHISEFGTFSLPNTHVKDLLSSEDVEYALACYLAKSKHNDVVYRNSVLEKVVRFMNQYGWHLSDDFRDYYKKYALFRWQELIGTRL